MPETAYYIYVLKDPRTGKPFYIGKGTGIRAWEHIASADNTRKGRRIAEIKNEGLEVIVSKLVDGLSELQALKLEAEFISGFGTEDTGGILTNSILPSGSSGKLPKSLVITLGLREKAQLGLGLLKDAVLELAQANQAGVTNSEVVKAFGLNSDYLGGSKDYLTWSLLGLLMREGKMKRVEKKKHKSAVR
jgi:uncharacterized protein